MTAAVVPFALQHIEPAAALEALCFSLPWSVAALTGEMDNPRARLWAAETDGCLVGYAGLHAVDETGYITNIAVHPDARRQGIASALLAAMEQDPALSELTLEVRVSNSAAISLYECHGYARCGVRRQFYTHPAEDGYIYTKKLR